MAAKGLVAGRRVWVWRLLAACLGPVVLLGGAELTLRLAGWGYSTSFLRAADSPGMVEPNPDFARQFYGERTAARATPFKIARSKDPQVVRLLVFGESAAAGTPDPAYAFSRILGLLLEQRFPGISFEVVNVAMRGVDSAIIRKIAHGCAELGADAFIVYMGNNEVIGLHGPEPGGGRWSQQVAVQRWIQGLRSTRLGQWLVSRLTRAAGPELQDQAFFRSKRLSYLDWRRGAVVDNFTANVEDLLVVADRSGAGVVLATVPVNLRDCPPLGSLYRPGLGAEERSRIESLVQAGEQAAAAGKPGEAVRRFSEALEIDDHPADLHFRLAEALAQAGDWTRAREHFARALDQDALQFRADDRLNAAIRETAKRRAGPRFRLLDAVQIFASSPLSDQGIAGARLFSDYVHPTFTGDYLLARSFLDGVTEVLKGRLPDAADAPPPLSEEDCRRALAFTAYEVSNVEQSALGLTAKPPFPDQVGYAERRRAREEAYRLGLARLDGGVLQHCIGTYRAALGRRPGDWMLHHNFAYFLLDVRQPAEAVEHAQVPVAQFPREAQFRDLLARALLSAGRVREGREQLEVALRCEPDHPGVLRTLRQLEGGGPAARP